MQFHSRSNVDLDPILLAALRLGSSVPSAPRWELWRNQFQSRSNGDLDLESEVIYFLKPYTPNNFYLMVLLKIRPPSSTLCSAQTPFSPSRAAPRTPIGGSTPLRPVLDPSPPPCEGFRSLSPTVCECTHANIYTYKQTHFLAYRYRLAGAPGLARATNILDKVLTNRKRI